MDATLPLQQRLAIRFHLLMCRYCARFRRQLIMLRMLSRDSDSDRSPDKSASATLSNETKERIKKAIHSQP